jgi:glycosyltransferase involved in cell wall biosynthesis
VNILFLDQFSDLGGGQLCLLDLLPAICDVGWNAVVAAPGEGKLFARCDSGVRTQPLPMRVNRIGQRKAGDAARFAFDLPQTLAAVRRLVEEHRIELVYVNGPRMIPVAAIAVGHKLPLIFHCHSYVPSHVAGPLNLALRYCRARVIACCKFVGEPFAARHPAVIYNAVVDHALPRVNRSRPRIGMLGRISPEKGHPEFLKAARNMPDYDYVICGEASDSRYERELRELAKGLPVEFTGWLDDVAPVLASLDLLVVPSAPTEATTRVIPEAYSAGVPVVARRGGGISEVVRHGETGYLIDSLDPGVIASSCRKALANGAAMAQRARLDYQQRFTLSRYRAEVLRVISNTIAQSKEQERCQ